MPADPDPPVDQAELVAYLDGELGTERARAVEARLARDPVARARAEALKKTYDLLDYLPRPEPSPDFTRRTLTMIDRPPAEVPTAPAGRYRYAVWAAAGVLACAGGYGAHALFPPAHRVGGELHFDDVRVIENLPLYVGVDDLAFLKRVDEAGLFPDEPGEAAGSGKPVLAGPVTTDRREALTALFRSYSPARQDQLRHLDRQLHELDPLTRARLDGVLERYAVWLDRLPDPDRKDVLAATTADRLDAVRRVRERAWRASLPAATRARLDAARGDDLARQIADLKADEADRRAGWDRVRRQWDAIRHQGRPWPFSDEHLRGPVETYVAALRIRLVAADLVTFDWVRERATRNPSPDGSGLDSLVYGAVLYELAQRHPGLPEFGNGSRTVSHPSDLPGDFVEDLRRAAKKAGLVRRVLNPSLAGKWPDFAEAIVKEAHELKVPVRFPVGPAKPGEFTPEVNDFVTGPLKKAVRPGEWEALHKLEGRWPDYPKRLLALAREHNLSVPGVSLPGPPRKWDEHYGPGGLRKWAGGIAAP